MTEEHSSMAHDAGAPPRSPLTEDAHALVFGEQTYRLPGPRPVGGPSVEDPPLHNTRTIEGLVALSFVVGFMGAAALGAAYWQAWSPTVEGIIALVTLGAMGVGVSAWGKYLMPQGPFVEERHPMSSSPQERAAFTASVERGVTVVARRSFLAKLLGLSAGAFGVVAVFPLIRSLGPRPGKSLYVTPWRRGSRLVFSDNSPVHVSALEIGSVTTVFPENGSSFSRAISQTLLIRPSNAPFTTKPGRETWTPLGYVAYSKVCTHAGCPVALYEEQLQQLLCPCHQSMFNVLDGAMPIFGPAPRPLPQLALYVDSHGYLRSQAPYDEPIGPGFWSRA